MSIEFRCPNGHRLNAADNKAGRAGVCPKCGAPFRVPSPGGSGVATSDSGAQAELGSSPSAVGGSAAEPGSSPSGLVGSTPGTGSSPSGFGGSMSGFLDAASHSSGSHENLSASALGLGPSQPEPVQPKPVAEAPKPVEEKAAVTPPPPATTGMDERIVFLCPNGHKLNCPATMQGRPGKCPHCGATFLVPDYESEFDEASLSQLTDESELEDDSLDEAPPEVNGYNAGYAADEFPFDLSEISGEARTQSPMASLFQRLWSQRQNGGVVELYLKGGEIVTPQWFSPQMSQDAIGMFGFTDGDGTYTLTAVQWESIERISLRGLPDLPPGIFPEEQR